MATISFEVPDEELRNWQRSNEDQRAHWTMAASADFHLAARIAALAYLAALDYPLPPKVEVGDVEVGDKVAWGSTLAPYLVVHVEDPFVFAVSESTDPKGMPHMAVAVRLDRPPQGFQVLERAQ